MDDLVELVRECIMENCHFTVTELICHFMQISHSHRLFRKLCARWMPKQLTSEHEAKCMESALTFLQQYHDDGDEFLDQTITGDEIWVAHIIPETKQQSMHWHHSGSPCNMKFKQTLLVRKVLCTVFWDRQGILLTRGEMVNAEHYCKTLAIQSKQHGMLSASVVLLGQTRHSPCQLPDQR